MKIVVVSDSHGARTLLEDIYEKHYDASFFLHLGDSQLPKYYLNHYCAIAGNCDYNDLPAERNIEIGGLLIHMEHGHRFKFMMNPTETINNTPCDIFLYGHTHVKKAIKMGEKYVFNPGSLTRPRDGDKGSYLVIDIDKDKNVTHKFYFID